MNKNKVVPGCTNNVKESELASFTSGSPMDTVRKAQIMRNLAAGCDACSRKSADFLAAGKRTLPQQRPAPSTGSDVCVRTAEYAAENAGGTRSSGRRVVRKNLPD